MTSTQWAMLGAVFLGGAFPWLEAIIVIPAGILAGLPTALVIIAAVAGNLLTVTLAAVAVGVRARRAFLRVGAGTVAWSGVAAALTLTGVSVAGIGA